jgi:hypothetical protein
MLNHFVRNFVVSFNVIPSAIFLKKIGSGTHGATQFGQRGVMWMPGKKGSGMPFWLASF